METLDAIPVVFATFDSLFDADELRDEDEAVHAWEQEAAADETPAREKAVPYYAPGVKFMVWKRWDDAAGKLVCCEGSHPDHVVDNRHALYDRVVGFRRANQEAINANPHIGELYATLRAEPKWRNAYEQRVEGFSLFERFVLERWPEEAYSRYLLFLELAELKLASIS